MMSITNKPKVFVDFHHASLLNSFILLFENRLGGSVYRPIGREWFDQGFWKIYDHPATVMQYLDVGGATPDRTPPLNELKDVTRSSDDTLIYNCQDIDSGFYNKAITFDAFMKLHIDIIIASIPQHIEPFKKLCELHPDKPKLIFQIGNAWTVDAGLAPNIMASALIENVPEHINFISYHQEFDLNVFKPLNMAKRNTISSFVNCFNVAGHFLSDWNLFMEVEEIMNDWAFRSYGGQCRDGAAHGSNQLAEFMNEAKFIWHTKNGGDGYGHIIYNASACGVPLITKKSYYENKMGAELMIDDVTCINIDGLTSNEVVEKIHYYSEPLRYQTMCDAVLSNFYKVVSFDIEETRLRAFIERLK